MLLVNKFVISADRSGIAVGKERSVIVSMLYKDCCDVISVFNIGSMNCGNWNEVSIIKWNDLLLMWL